ncbi:hypothetical protein CFAM422_007999 [Trichoderma lentiforme]|uniref:Nucleoside phosphorylase domain-containing protein n=1 Tax=Trichoderma lentiforme TaxID=1567552 RepID=A0A9P4XDH0_9HYPO|nr:hypothetical protein CFAM422_007999 [Trichoderma lentiforme]
MEAIRAAPQPNLTLADYTIGWICTKHIEYDAAQLFLDETHPDIAPSNGGHTYTLGKIGKHNVVIATMANMFREEATATNLICSMKSAFPNISINLMVGIGSGAPSLTHDIRLGDVVVSAPDPESGSPAVFAYNFDKTVQDGTLHEITPHLNRPLSLLMSSVGSLHTSYRLKGHQIEDDISSILEKRPGLRQKYERPQLSSDRLYKSTVNHPLNNEEGRKISYEKDVSMLVQRPERARNKANPCIHHGTIASGCQVMKDAIIRDKLISENNDIVCFDTEVVRVFMYNVPGLVVRGICDYSDSHKNEEWQGYAAMTAAAYAKDIVRNIPPSTGFRKRMF